VDFSLSNENIIWDKMLSGDRDALGKLMHIYFRPLANYGLRFTTDKEVIKDAIQELFIVVWERRSHLAVAVNVKSYLFSSFRRLLLRILKKMHKTATLTLDSSYLENFALILGVDDKIIETEHALKLSKHFNILISSLPERQKEVVYLKFFESLSREEISLVLEIAPQTVSNILQIALGKLRQGTPVSIWRALLIPFFISFIEVFTK
jgi:RNA polymerase sigma factor (sigma-70 family)